MGEKKRKDGRPVPVKPQWVDGKLIKECECGCGVIIEVHPKSAGTQMYSPACSARIKKEREKAWYLAAGQVACRKCGQKKPRDQFLEGNDGLTLTCKDCMPFELNWAKNMPECGKYKNDTTFPDGFTEEHATCRAYKECQARLAAGVWLPCSVPERSELIKFVFSEPEEREYIRSIVTVRFDRTGRRLIADSVDRYLEYYYSLGAKYESEVQDEQPQPVSLPVNSDYITVSANL